MALEEEQSSTMQEMRPAIDCLRSCADLTLVETSVLEELAAGCAHFSLPAGGRLFEVGAAPDGVYLLTSGRLGISASGSGPWEAEIAAGELVGEVGWLLSGPRTVCAAALRDSELLWMPTSLMESASSQSTTLSLALARLCARRLQRSTRGLRDVKRARVFVIVPNNVEIDVAELATQLVANLPWPAPRSWSGMSAPARIPRRGSAASRSSMILSCMWPTRPRPGGRANVAGKPTSFCSPPAPARRCSPGRLVSQTPP